MGARSGLGLRVRVRVRVRLTCAHEQGAREELDFVWYNVLPEFRDGMYFQQMVKQL